MRETASQSRALCCISVQIKSYPAFAIAQYVSGVSVLSTVPPVTFSPFIILIITGFQIPAFAGASYAGPYFHFAGSSGPWFTAPAGAAFIWPESCPAAAASGNAALGAAVCPNAQTATNPIAAQPAIK
jgi:hypothetical protein